MYAPHFLYSSDADYNESVEHELKLDKPQLSDLFTECKEILASVGKLLTSYDAKADSDPKPKVVKHQESESEVEEAEPEVEESLIKTL